MKKIIGLRCAGYNNIDLKSLHNKIEAVVFFISPRTRYLVTCRINEDNKTEFNALMNTFVPNSEDDFDDRDNTEQEKISVEFEKRQKPHLQSLKKMLDGEVEYRYKAKDE